VAVFGDANGGTGTQGGNGGVAVMGQAKGGGNGGHDGISVNPPDQGGIDIYGTRLGGM
jgi:hypothetical protein